MNQLANETSPYLLQHAHNPVEWYAWRPEALDRARRENKLILVSIGYSTCHWCHVMERESFENQAVAAYMNQHFVCIKVDREERPDVDAIYMEACQILTGSGGWPLNCFLTPDARPFYAGTYYPPRPAHQRPSWMQVLEYMAQVWQAEPDKVQAQAERLLGSMERSDRALWRPAEALDPAPSSMGFGVPAEVENTFFALRDNFDRAEGGFGGAPKFPGTMSIAYLLHYHHLTGHAEARQHAVFSLVSMLRGGIYDQLGGGLARYATDRAWLVPHFEKMLYDNALLVSTLADAYRLEAADPATDPALLDELRAGMTDTLEWVRREMTHPEGGFYAAQDADSEGVEGRFFVWQRTEVEQILGEKADLFCQFYDITTHGNWEETNILHRPVALADLAAQRDMAPEALSVFLQECRTQLFEVRSRRVWPGLDDKVIVAWNALMASGHLAAAAALADDSYAEVARRNVDFLLEKCWGIDPTSAAPMADFDPKNARHVWHTTHPAFLEDYAYIVAALLDTYEWFFEKKYLDVAAGLVEVVLRDFSDADTGLFFFTSVQQSDLIFRKKDLYDNATPSANSTLAYNLQRLALLLDRPDWQARADQMLEGMRASVERFPQAFARWATARLCAVFPRVELALVGDNAVAKARELQRRYLPARVICAAPQPTDALPLLAGKSGEVDALVYVCQQYACQRPVQALTEVWPLLT
jgi:uncharacterized protein